MAIPQYNGHALTFLKLDAVAAASTTEIVAAPGAGKKIVVVHYEVQLDAAGSYQWTDGTTDFTGAVSVAVDVPVVSPWGPLFVVGANLGLDLTLAGASAAANGLLVYYITEDP